MEIAYVIRDKQKYQGNCIYRDTQKCHRNCISIRLLCRIIMENAYLRCIQNYHRNYIHFLGIGIHGNIIQFSFHRNIEEILRILIGISRGVIPRANFLPILHHALPGRRVLISGWNVVFDCRNVVFECRKVVFHFLPVVFDHFTSKVADSSG